MSTQPNSTVTIEVQPPLSVQKDSAITPTVKAKLQFSSNSSLKDKVDDIFAVAVVKDMNGSPIANYDYAGNMETRYQSKQTVGGKTNLTYKFSDLAIYKAGTFRIHVSICRMDGTGSEVLCHVESSTFMVY